MRNRVASEPVCVSEANAGEVKRPARATTTRARRRFTKFLKENINPLRGAYFRCVAGDWLRPTNKENGAGCDKEMSCDVKDSEQGHDLVGKWRVQGGTLDVHCETGCGSATGNEILQLVAMMRLNDSGSIARPWARSRESMCGC